MDISININASSSQTIDHVTNTLTGPNGFNQVHDSHPEGETVVFSGVNDEGTYILSSQAYADRDDHEVGDATETRITIEKVAPTVVTVQ